MKSIRLGLVVLLAGLVSLESVAFSEAITPTTTPFQDITQGFSNPKDIAKYLKKNFKFTEDSDLFDKVDYWQSPDEFLERRKGDCEDYALFSKKALEEQGWEAYVVSFYGYDGFAHTVTVYKDGDRFNVINEDRLYRYKAKSMEEALTRVHPFWTWAAIAEQRGTRGWMKEKIRNPAHF